MDSSGCSSVRLTEQVTVHRHKVDLKAVNEHKRKTVENRWDSGRHGPQCGNKLDPFSFSFGIQRTLQRVINHITRIQWRQTIQNQSQQLHLSVSDWGEQKRPNNVQRAKTTTAKVSEAWQVSGGKSTITVQITNSHALLRLPTSFKPLTEDVSGN